MDYELLEEEMAKKRELLGASILEKWLGIRAPKPNECASIDRELDEQFEAQEKECKKTAKDSRKRPYQNALCLNYAK